jgi:hypothetical protein
MAYNISPLINITNIFGNWLTEIDKKNKAKMHIQLYVGLFRHVETTLFLTA